VRKRAELVIYISHDLRHTSHAVADDWGRSLRVEGKPRSQGIALPQGSSYIDGTKVQWWTRWRRLWAMSTQANEGDTLTQPTRPRAGVKVLGKRWGWEK